MKFDRHDDPTGVFFASLDAGDLFFTESPEVAECSGRASILFMKTTDSNIVINVETGGIYNTDCFSSRLVYPVLRPITLYPNLKE